MLDRRDQKRMRTREGVHAAWEAFIVVLVCINLALILFDSLFAVDPLNQALARWLPGLHATYAEHVHDNFVFIDLMFVAVLVFDVLLGWVVSLFEHRYRRWYYYPFVHWYDVLGCIPLAGFRWLRVLRVGSLLLRLQRLGLIDMRRWGIYEFGNHYYQRLLDEISNRVMVKMFTRLQEEIGTSQDLAKRLVTDVVRPRKDRLLKDLSRRTQAMIEGGYRDNRGAIEGYVSNLIRQALADNAEMRNLRRLPLGNRLASTLDEALADVASRLIQAAVDGLNAPQSQQLAANLADRFFEAWLYQGDDTDLALEELLVDVIEVLKEQLVDRQWSAFVGPHKPERSEAGSSPLA
ncbi:ion transporter [Stutzerimonas tarimensis]|uniref:Ion transporter n=1 Tax=Stutzerimonas tarimensis TaxID=1507735 RepID=A0ABV7T0C4_9GAMM